MRAATTLRQRCGRVLVYATAAVMISGCVPVGARWQNMFAVLGLG